LTTGTERSRATRESLQAAALDTLRTEGVAGLSARVVADRAGQNQALIFYHFGSVGGLVDAACRASVEQSTGRYRAELAAAASFGQLLDVGRRLHDQERELGNVRVMAQLLAGAQQDSALAETARFCLQRWHAEIEPTVRRLLTGSPLELIVEPSALARTISAGFVGLELYEGVDPDGARGAVDALQRLGVLVEAVDDLGPIARRALRTTLRRAGLASADTPTRRSRRSGRATE
jgi:AcrR family transcriptional regulator